LGFLPGEPFGKVLTLSRRCKSGIYLKLRMRDKAAEKGTWFLRAATKEVEQEPHCVDSG